MSIPGDAQIKGYTNLLLDVIKQIQDVKGLTRTVIITELNESFIYGKDVRKPTGSIMRNKVRHDIEQLNDQRYSYLKRILRFCLNTDVVKKLGMSLPDLMALDFPTYEFIEQEYYNHKPVEQDAMEGVMRDLQKSLDQKPGKK